MPGASGGGDSIAHLHLHTEFSMLDGAARVKEVIASKGANMPVIAKLEKPEAIGRLPEIIAAAEGVMVARGDLAVESSAERVPLLQKEIIREANRRGKMVITANAHQRLDPTDVNEGLRRHASADWGELPPEDAELNELGLKEGGRLFSAYGTGEKRFWIITEWDRSVTTILMPEDY